jgi:regulator of sigma E protease
MDTLIDILRYVQVALGIGLVIFVHELGHFLAARYCGVRVDVFSLGFGPRIWSRERNNTRFQIALIPLGGYVKMAGEEGSEDPPKPYELRAKSVSQRFLIFSGGVIMNVIFGMVVFPIVLAVGVPFTQPVLGTPVPGSPAWKAGLESGTRVLSINDKTVFGFLNIANEIALGPPEGAVLEILEPGAEEARLVTIVPVYDERTGTLSVGFTPPTDPKYRIKVAKGSPAALAGLTSGDLLTGVGGATEGLSRQLQLELALRAGGPVNLHIERDGESRDVIIHPDEGPLAPVPLLGIARPVQRVLALRAHPILDRLGLREGDRLMAVSGTPILRHGDLHLALVGGGEAKVFAVRRDGAALSLSLPALAQGEGLGLAACVALGEDWNTTRLTIVPGSASDRAGLRDGDRLVRMDGSKIEGHQDIRTLSRAAAAAESSLTLDVFRDDPSGGEPLSIQIQVTPAPWHAPIYGVRLALAEYVYKAPTLWKAVTVGVASSWRFVEEAWLTLQRVASRQVKGDNIGGIITIGVVSHTWASVSFTKFLFFLCMLSMNLAFLNVLPIPVLDGGHLFFLLIEKIKGSPVSEKVFGYSQMAGLIVILSLMLYVTYNDIMRWIF